MANESNEELFVVYSEEKPAVVAKIGKNVCKDNFFHIGQVIITCKCKDTNGIIHVRTGPNESGLIQEVLVKTDDEVTKGVKLLKYSKCKHEIVMKDICAECGVDLRDRERDAPQTAAVSMVHNVPELMVSMEQAQTIGRAEQDQLLKSRKLVLLVDLDQTLIHTTNDIIDPNMKDVFHFQLLGHPNVWYHTRMRPHLMEFLEEISKFFEMHIVTFGTRMYAHTIASHLDPDKKLFGNRILSRDECFNPLSKSANLKALFPCGDNFVCIIDDREEVWNYAPNLIHVKAYHFFKHTGDINAPPGLDKRELDEDVLKNEQQAEEKEQLDDTDDSNDGKEPGDPTGTAQDPETIDEKKPADGSAEETDQSEVESGKDKPEELDAKKVNGGNTEEAERESNAGNGVEMKDENVKPNEAECSEPLKEDEKLEDNKENLREDSDKQKEDKENPEEVEKVERVDSENKKVASEIELPHQEAKKNESVSDNLKTQPTDQMSYPEDTDDYLKYLEDILKSIHKAFFEMYDASLKDGCGLVPDLKSVIPYVRSKVLAGVNLVFSHVVPNRDVLEKSRPYLVARSLGASVTREIIPRKSGKKEEATTHLVAASLGTAKVRQAQKLKYIKIVTPEWLWTCAERWEHVDERVFPLTDTKAFVKVRAPAHCTTSQIALMMAKNQKKSQPIRESRNLPPELPVYDPVTGKQIRKRSEPTKKGATFDNPTEEISAPSFRESINPFLSFSEEELDEMSEEVDSEAEDTEGDSEMPYDIGDESRDGLSAEDEDAAKKLLANFADAEEDSEFGPSGDVYEEDHPHGWKVSLHHTSDDHFEIGESDEEEDRPSRKRRLDEEEDETINQKFRRGEEIPDDLELDQPDPDRDEISDVEGNLEYS